MNGSVGVVPVPSVAADVAVVSAAEVVATAVSSSLIASKARPMRERFRRQRPNSTKASASATCHHWVEGGRHELDRYDDASGELVQRFYMVGETFTGWDPVLRHLDHLIGILGEDRVGLGSDFDGATVPKGIGDVTGQQALLQAMREHGYGEALLRKIAHENWFRVLERTWGA